MGSPITAALANSGCADGCPSRGTAAEPLTSKAEDLLKVLGAEIGLGRAAEQGYRDPRREA